MTADEWCLDLPETVLPSGLELAESVAPDFIEADAEGVLGEVSTDSDPLHPVQVSVCESDGLTLDTSLTDSVPSPTGRYELRPR